MSHRSQLWIVWVLMLWGALSLRDLPWPQRHSICGPWGCGPAIPALLAVQGAWTVLLLPVAILLRQRQGQRWAQAARRGWLASGIAGIVVVGLYEAVCWLPSVGPWGRDYFLQRWAFAVITLTDVPLAPGVAIASCLILFPPRTASLTAILTPRETGPASTSRVAGQVATNR